MSAHLDLVARLVILAGLIGWRIFYLWHRPTQPGSWAVVGALVLVFASVLIQLMGHLGRDNYWFVWGQAVTLMAGLFALNVYLAIASGLRRMAIAIIGVLALVGAAVAFTSAWLTAQVPGGVTPSIDSPHMAPHVRALVVTIVVYLPPALMTAAVLSAALSFHASGPLRLGLRIIAAGLVCMTGSSVLILVSMTALRAAGFDRGPLIQITNALLVMGVTAFLVGIAIPGAVQRYRAARMWDQHRRELVVMSGLRADLTHLLPQLALIRRTVRLPWWKVHERHYRSYVEIRDGLLQISAHLRSMPGTAPAERTPETLASNIRSLVVRDVRRDCLRRGPAHATLGHSTTFDDDAARIVHLARVYGARSQMQGSVSA